MEVSLMVTIKAPVVSVQPTNSEKVKGLPYVLSLDTGLGSSFEFFLDEKGLRRIASVNPDEGIDVKISTGTAPSGSVRYAYIPAPFDEIGKMGADTIMDETAIVFDVGSIVVEILGLNTVVETVRSFLEEGQPVTGRKQTATKGFVVAKTFLFEPPIALPGRDTILVRSVEVVDYEGVFRKVVDYYGGSGKVRAEKAPKIKGRMVLETSPKDVEFDGSVLVCMEDGFLFYVGSNEPHWKSLANLVRYLSSGGELTEPITGSFD